MPSKAYVPSFITDRPPTDIPLDGDSIMIRHQGAEYLIGGLAKKHSPNSERTFGGSFKTPAFQRLVMALIAKTLGEGDHNTNIALCSPHNWVDELRDSPREITLSDEQEAKFRELISDIEFKEDHTSSEWKRCHVRPTEKTQVFHELQAVSLAIPADLKSYVLWQLGHGDLQQGVIIDGMPMVKGFHRAKGISGAVERMSRDLKLSISYCERAFLTNKLPEIGGMNGKTVDCTEQKKDAIRKYFTEVIGRFLNILDPYKDRAKNIVLSGGGAKDKVLVDVLKEEVENYGFKLHTIDNLPVESEDCKDPVMTAVMGMQRRADLAIDPGNNHLKSFWRG